MGNGVNNVDSAGAVPEITTKTSATPEQLYRNTDNKYFEPKLIVAVNFDSTNIQKIKLVDADLTDSGEDSNKAETKPVYIFTVGPEDTTILREKDLKGLKFRYGVGGYNSVSADPGTFVYIAGEEN